MALSEKELLKNSGSDIFPVADRVVPGPGPGAIATRIFANDAGAALLPRLTPVAQVSGKLVEWAYVDGSQTEGTAEVIVGFVWPEGVQLDATDDTNGNVLLKGQVDYRDVPLPSGQLQANLEGALAAAALRFRGLFITGGLSTSL